MSFNYPSSNWRERGYHKPGRKPDLAKNAIKKRFSLTKCESRRLPLGQLTQCKDASAIRLLSGKSR